MSTDPTTVDRPMATAPMSPSTRPRGRRRIVVGLTGLILAVTAGWLAVGDDGAAGPGNRNGSIFPEAPWPSNASKNASGATTSTTPASTTSAPAAGAESTAPPDGGDAEGAGPVVPSGALLALTPGSGLDFDVATVELAMTVRNDGDLAADWAIELSNPEVTVSPAAGSLDPGEAVELSVVVDRTNLPNGVIYTELQVVSDAVLAHGDMVWPIFVTVEKAEITDVAVGPQVICASQSPGAGPKVATIQVTGFHMQNAASVWAAIDTPALGVVKALGFDMVNERWITTYSSTTIGLHTVSAYAAGSLAIQGLVGAVPVQVIWCP